MAQKIVLQIEVTWPEDLQTWEAYFYQVGWQVVGKRRRTVVARFGEMTIERRLYRDEEGESHFLLDAHMARCRIGGRSPEHVWPLLHTGLTPRDSENSGMTALGCRPAFPPCTARTYAILSACG